MSAPAVVLRGGPAVRAPNRAPQRAPTPDAPLVDQHGRSIEYLRVSVTDRCNLRCVYCMPAAGLPWLPKGDVLADDELVAVVDELASLGLRRVRLTGGEPTIRPGLERLVARLAAVPGVEELSLSTNGVRFCQDPGLARRLADAGLGRVNISADSLRADRVAAIARRDLGLDPVRAAELAEAAGLAPVKLNVVVVRGVNDDEVGDFARLTVDRPWAVRFIELMPVGELAEAYGGDVLGRVVPSEEVLARAADALAPWGGLVPLGAGQLAGNGPAGNGPAAYYGAPGAAGTVGVITPMTHTYCASCNRVRLTADGRLRTCLYGDHEVDLRGPLRRGEPLAGHVRAALAAKPREHALLQLRTGGLRALSQVGG
ncbi:GTP 3',8-cyclase [Gemmatimonadetes bacterium T265]|nr:GTP 3',8-cyclase [Gemmatimonadetes bacterium T265]